MKNSYYDSPFTIQRLEKEPEVKIYHNDIAGCIRICHNPSEHRYYTDASQSNDFERIDARISDAVKAELLKIRASSAEKSSRGQKKRKRYYN